MNTGTVKERNFWIKIKKNIACDVKVGTKNAKFICVDRVSVVLYFNLKWHMPLCGEICHAE